MSSPFDLSGRLALITGGGRGLGREMALSFAAHGATVVIASRKADVIEASANEIAEATGQTVVAMPCHVGRWDEVSALADDVYERFGRVDVLVNNAGMSPLYDKLSNVTEELFDKVMDVNVKGPFRLGSVIGERMKQAGRGSIINVSSTSSLRPGPAEVPYAAAKAGVNALTVGLAQSFGPEVRVNCIMPGPFRTDISKAWDWDVIDRAMQRVPMGRVGEPNEIVGAALLLASDAGAYMSGSIIKVDGGMSGIVGSG